MPDKWSEWNVLYGVFFFNSMNKGRRQSWPIVVYIGQTTYWMSRGSLSVWSVLLSVKVHSWNSILTKSPNYQLSKEYDIMLKALDGMCVVLVEDQKWKKSKLCTVFFLILSQCCIECNALIMTSYFTEEKSAQPH